MAAPGDSRAGKTKPLTDVTLKASTPSSEPQHVDELKPSVRKGIDTTHHHVHQHTCLIRNFCSEKYTPHNPSSALPVQASSRVDCVVEFTASDPGPAYIGAHPRGQRMLLSQQPGCQSRQATRTHHLRQMQASSDCCTHWVLAAGAMPIMGLRHKHAHLLHTASLQKRTTSGPHRAPCVLWHKTALACKPFAQTSWDQACTACDAAQPSKLLLLLLHGSGPSLNTPRGASKTPPPPPPGPQGCTPQDNTPQPPHTLQAHTP